MLSFFRHTVSCDYSPFRTERVYFYTHSYKEAKKIANKWVADNPHGKAVVSIPPSPDKVLVTPLPLWNVQTGPGEMIRRTPCPP